MAQLMHAPVLPAQPAAVFKKVLYCAALRMMAQGGFDLFLFINS
jgi:hypothetical protein